MRINGRASAIPDRSVLASRRKLQKAEAKETSNSPDHLWILIHPEQITQGRQAPLSGELNGPVPIIGQPCREMNERQRQRESRRGAADCPDISANAPAILPFKHNQKCERC